MPYLEKQLQGRRRKAYAWTAVLVAVLCAGVEMFLIWSGAGQVGLNRLNRLLMALLPVTLIAFAVICFVAVNLTHRAKRRRAYACLAPAQLERCDAELRGSNLFEKQVTVTQDLLIVKNGGFYLNLIPVSEIQEVVGPDYKKGTPRHRHRNVWAYLRIGCKDKRFDFMIKDVFTGTDRERQVHREFDRLADEIRDAVNSRGTA